MQQGLDGLDYDGKKAFGFIMNVAMLGVGMTIKYLVWTEGLKGPTLEILNGLDQNKDSHSRDKKKIFQQHELLPEYEGMTLTQLALIFPYKG